MVEIEKQFENTFCDLRKHDRKKPFTRRFFAISPKHY